MIEDEGNKQSLTYLNNELLKDVTTLSAGIKKNEKEVVSLLEEIKENKKEMKSTVNSVHRANLKALIDNAKLKIDALKANIDASLKILPQLEAELRSEANEYKKSLGDGEEILKKILKSDDLAIKTDKKKSIQTEGTTQTEKITQSEEVTQSQDDKEFEKKQRLAAIQSSKSIQFISDKSLRKSCAMEAKERYLTLVLQKEYVKEYNASENKINTLHELLNQFTQLAIEGGVNISNWGFLGKLSDAIKNNEPKKGFEILFNAIRSNANAIAGSGKFDIFTLKPLADTSKQTIQQAKDEEALRQEEIRKTANLLRKVGLHSPVMPELPKTPEMPTSGEPEAKEETAAKPTENVPEKPVAPDPPPTTNNPGWWNVTNLGDLLKASLIIEINPEHTPTPEPQAKEGIASRLTQSAPAPEKAPAAPPVTKSQQWKDVRSTSVTKKTSTTATEPNETSTSGPKLGRRGNTDQ